MPARLVRIAFTPSGSAERSKVCAELPNQGDKFFDETLEVDIPPLDYPASAGGVGGTMRDAGDDGPDFPRQVGMLADVERVGDPLFRCLIPDHQVNEFQAARNAASNEGLRIRLNLCRSDDDTPVSPGRRQGAQHRRAVMLEFMRVLAGFESVSHPITGQARDSGEIEGGG
ncbi:hypothetical protein [Sphingomonas sp. SORGH_AS_0879]|uniref:hypothetical protein n=1 Tax=Sphingomonas sp. SORGH_AS_0879 TaxID=3041790 RepID=UPI002780BA63|nr:hypothetical protein [Sphingomonas sp. SORGH_AS_0879]MDQ1230984.1 hypothetical protein [Sphingomonas sp. SORGH_AS_0879]